MKRVSGKLDIVAHVAFNSHNGVRDLSEAMNQLTWYTKLIIDEFANKVNPADKILRRFAALHYAVFCS